MRFWYRELFRAVVGWIAIFFVVLIILFSVGRELTRELIWQQLWTGMIFTIIIYMSNALVFRYVLKKYTKRIFTIQILPLAILGNIVASLIGIFVSRFVLFVFFYSKPWDEFVMGERPQYYYFSFLWQR